MLDAAVQKIIINKMYVEKNCPIVLSLWKSLLSDLNECVVLKGLCRGCFSGIILLATKEKMETNLMTGQLNSFAAWIVSP